MTNYGKMLRVLASGGVDFILPSTELRRTCTARPGRPSMSMSFRDGPGGMRNFRCYWKAAERPIAKAEAVEFSTFRLFDFERILTPPPISSAEPEFIPVIVSARLI